jgi:predicted DNA-binding protein (MmcQ/YjbR family)
MHVEQFRNYCLSKKGSSEDFPFDEQTLVFKVLGKIFALTNINAPSLSVNLKMDKELVEDWRARYDAIQPGYHMNKSMWNTIDFSGNSIPKNELHWLIDHSYEEVCKKFTKKEKEQLQQL